MGKVQVLTKGQQIILAEVKQNPLFRQFYFTGGTALSAFYLRHRYSEDLDFFTREELNVDRIAEVVNKWSQEYNFTFSEEFQEVVYIFLLKFKGGKSVKVDFGYYPYRQIDDFNIIDGVKTDSLADIAVNKLLTVTQRTTIKDFVDLYFLLQKITLWELIEGVKIKFKLEIEPFILASDLLKVEEFDFLPRMIKPLTINQLKSFFRKEAKKLGLKTAK